MTISATDKTHIWAGRVIITKNLKFMKQDHLFKPLRFV